MKRLFTLWLMLWSVVVVMAITITDDTGQWNFDASGNRATIKGFATGYKHSGNLVIPRQVTAQGEVYDVVGVGAKAFMNKKLTGKLILPEGLESIGERAFDRCKFDGELKLPTTLKTIGAYAFVACKFTGTLVIPEQMTMLSIAAFQNCKGFTGDLVIPDNIVAMGANVFKGCSGFDGRLVLSRNLTQIPSGAFDECENLSGSLDLPPGITVIDNSAFRLCGKLTGKLVLPEGLLRIGVAAFYECVGFSGELHFPSTLVELESNTFKGCTGFTGDLIIPDNVREVVGGSAFWGCTGFNGKLIIPKSWTKIPLATFQGCTGLVGEVVIPENVKVIERSAFADTPNLKSVVLPTALESLGENAFANSGIGGGIKLPSSLKSIDNRVFGVSNNIVYIDATELAPGVITTASRKSGVFHEVRPYVMVYLPVGVTVSAEQENFVVDAQCANFVVYDNYQTDKENGCDYPIQYDFTATKASYKNREAFADYDCYTSYLPYPTTIPVGMKAYEVLKRKEADQVIVFTQVEGSVLKANMPYLLKMEEGVNKATYPEMSNVFVPKSPENMFERSDLNQPAEALGWKFLGTTMVIDNATAADNRACLLGEGDTWYPIVREEAGGYLHSMRAFVQSPIGTSSGARIAFLLEDHDVTAIDAIREAIVAKRAAIYTVSGRYVGSDYDKLPNGLYIVNGKTVYKGLN